MSLPHLAVFPSDDADGVALYLSPAGNGDWYAQVSPQRGDGGLPMADEAVRFCTIGSAFPPETVVAIALLYRLGTEDLAQAEWLAQSLLTQIQEKRKRGPHG